MVSRRLFDGAQKELGLLPIANNAASDEAYRVAERLVEEARASGAESLSFAREDCHALDRLPEGIAGLSRLTQLSLSGTQVGDLSPLAWLTGLTGLSLDSTKVDDLYPVAGLTGLTRLSLSGTQVSDFSPLAGLTGLTGLSSNRTQVSDLSALAGLTGLTMLSLGDTQVSDLSPLAGLTGLTQLWLSGTQVGDLSPLAGLTGLTQLWLNGTQVSDLSPLMQLKGLTVLRLSQTQVSDSNTFSLTALTGLTELWLSHTQVSDLSFLADLTEIRELLLYGIPATDLRPLRKLTRLATAPEGFGLTFKDTGAARIDDRIAEIAEIKDNAERARALFEYLEGREPPSDAAGSVPPPDDLLPILFQDGRLEVAQSLPTEAERDERLKQVLHERMRAKARELAQAAGNRFPRLAVRARAVAAQVDRPFFEVDLLVLHLDVEDLAARELTGEEEGEVYPPEVTGPLSDVLRIGPGLTLGNPDVDKLIERTNRAKGKPIPTDEKAAHDRMSEVTAADQAAIGDGLRALEGRMDSLPAEVALVTQRAAHRNMLWRIGVVSMFAVDVALNVATNVVSAHYQHQIVAFVQTNWPILMEVAATYGSAFAEWFAASMGSVPDLATLSRETLDRLRARKGRRS
jgi:internalin A